VLKWLTPQAPAGGRAKLWQGDDDFVQAPLPAYAKAKQAQDSGFRIGQSVRHVKFGDGVIVSSKGSGQDLQVEVNFGRNGVKRLLLAHAKLEAV
jgi:DNA helicase-2/ATP-dependent DNA helicase PcrA